VPAPKPLHQAPPEQMSRKARRRAKGSLDRPAQHPSEVLRLNRTGIAQHSRSARKPALKRLPPRTRFPQATNGLRLQAYFAPPRPISPPPRRPHRQNSLGARPPAPWASSPSTYPTTKKPKTTTPEVGWSHFFFFFFFCPGLPAIPRRLPRLHSLGILQRDAPPSGIRSWPLANPQSGTGTSWGRSSGPFFR